MFDARNPLAFPKGSFNQKVQPPTSDPDEGEQMSVCFSVEYLPYILGALDQGLLPYTWDGDADAVQLAQNRWTLLKEQIANPVCTSDRVPTPFWDEDSADDADDTANVEDQPWYGDIVIIDDRLTFVENAFIFVVAGFIAYAGLPTAAISFIPIARQFVVTAKSNPLGGIVRFLADAVEIGRVDTYAPSDGVVSTSLIMPEPTMGFTAEDVTYPTLWCELLPDNPHDLPSVSMSIIRSRLSASDVSGNPTRIRFNDETGTIQTSPDGGTTWVDNPEADPRYGMAFLKPPPGTATAQCDTAANRVKWVRDFINNCISALGVASEMFQIANIALTAYELLFAEAGLIVDLIFGVAELITEAGGDALNAAFSTTVYDALLCLFFCDANSDGSYDEARFDALVADIDSSADINATARAILDLILGAQGWNGVNNAGMVGGQTGDCGTCDCGWCLQTNFADDDGGYAPLDPSLGGVYSPGTGWVSTSGSGIAAGIYIHQSSIPGVYTHIEFTYDATGTFENWHIIGSLSGTTVFDHSGAIPPNHSTAAWDGNEELDAIDLQIGLSGSGEGAQMTHALYRGLEDVPPIPADPC